MRWWLRAPSSGCMRMLYCVRCRHQGQPQQQHRQQRHTTNLGTAEHRHLRRGRMRRSAAARSSAAGARGRSILLLHAGRLGLSQPEHHCGATGSATRSAPCVHAGVCVRNDTTEPLSLPQWL